jgi:hypothetical protein
LSVELEEALRRYRPSGPPAGLRDRALGRDDVGRPFQGRRWREWLAPAAAAAAAFLLYALTDSAHRRVISATSPADGDRETAIAETAVDLGGDDSARLEAERLITAMGSTGVDPQFQGTAIEESTP